MDPRYLMAETFRMLRNKPELSKEFDRKLNNEVGSPEEAVLLCLEYMELANA
jgi:hypothetical protein